VIEGEDVRLNQCYLMALRVMKKEIQKGRIEINKQSFDYSYFKREKERFINSYTFLFSKISCS